MSPTKSFRNATLCLLAAAPALSAQLVTVAQAGGGETLRPVTSPLRGLATSADGRIWTLVQWSAASRRALRLMVSADNGKTWRIATTTRTANSIRGSLVTGTDGKTLHVVWRAAAGTVGTSIYYAPYDTTKNRWAANDHLLIRGGNTTNEQYLEPHVATTKKGTLVVSFYQHRQGMLRAWSGAAMIGKDGRWTKPLQVNVDTYGVAIDAMTLGEDAHFAYRTNSGGYGIRYRRMDTANLRFGAEGEIKVSEANSAKQGSASSGNNVAVAPNGDTYVLYATGDRTAGKGALWIGYSKAGAYKFDTHVKVADDAPLLGGNKTYYHYGLSVNQDGRVYVLYSLAAQSHTKLYARWMSGAQILPPRPITLATRPAGSFTWISGHRVALGHFGFMATAYDASHTGGRALFYGGQTNGAVVFHGQGCQGTLNRAPHLGTGSLPSVGQTLSVMLSELPATRPGILLIGLSNQRLGAIQLPLDMAVLQMKGCFLVQDFFVNVVYNSNARGTAAAGIPLPNDSRLAGLPLFFQAYQIAPGANANNAIMSNGIAAVSR